MTLTAYQLWEGGSESPALHFTASEEQSLFALVKTKNTAGPNEQLPKELPVECVRRGLSSPAP